MAGCRINSHETVTENCSWLYSFVSSISFNCILVSSCWSGVFFLVTGSIFHQLLVSILAMQLVTISCCSTPDGSGSAHWKKQLLMQSFALPSSRFGNNWPNSVSQLAKLSGNVLFVEFLCFLPGVPAELPYCLCEHQSQLSKLVSSWLGGRQGRASLAEVNINLTFFQKLTLTIQKEVNGFLLM